MYALNEFEWDGIEFEKKFELGDGEKKVTVFLPWSFSLSLKELTLDDNSSLSPIKREKNMLVIGDSITHGYDALYPSHSPYP